jgi:hypothetical protein
MAETVLDWIIGFSYAFLAVALVVSAVALIAAFRLQGTTRITRKPGRPFRFLPWG